jgi:hypothetical protein
MANSAYPITKNLHLYQGDTWQREFAHDYDAADVDGAGFAISLQAGAAPFYTINDTDEAGQFSTTDKLTTVSLPATDAELFDAGIYFYDVQLDVGGTIITVARGSFTVEGDAYDGGGGGMGFPTTELSNRLIAWTLAQAWSYTSITRDADGVITTASIRWPDNTSGTLTRTAKNLSYLVMTGFSVSYNALTVTQPVISLDTNGRIAVRPRPTVA